MMRKKKKKWQRRSRQAVIHSVDLLVSNYLDVVGEAPSCRVFVIREYCSKHTGNTRHDHIICKNVCTQHFELIYTLFLYIHLLTYVKHTCTWSLYMDSQPTKNPPPFSIQSIPRSIPRLCRRSSSTTLFLQCLSSCNRSLNSS